MDNRIKKFLLDILESVESIDKYLGEKRDFSVYKSNKMLRRAVEREFEIIGEAMNRIDNSSNGNLLKLYKMQQITTLFPAKNAPNNLQMR